MNSVDKRLEDSKTIYFQRQSSRLFQDTRKCYLWYWLRSSKPKSLRSDDRLDASYRSFLEATQAFTSLEAHASQHAWKRNNHS